MKNSVNLEGIRPANERDIPVILEIWLEGSRLSHDFIPFDYWVNKASDMRTLYLPNAETYVVDESGQIQGFVSLVEDYLAALFVRPRAQGFGYGKRLLTFAKAHRGKLSLSVYAQNTRAVRFYQQQGFATGEQRLDPQTGQLELVMTWAST